MPRITYVHGRKFRPDTLRIIELADEIASDYRARGFDLTLRQLYYQFVARDLLRNTEQSYNRLGSIVSDARLAGLLDWSMLKDRGRAAYSTGWHDAVIPEQADLVHDAADGYLLDLWDGQPRRVEVWVEKQALEQVAERAAGSFRTGYFACKGYVSQSTMWEAGRRLRRISQQGYEPLVLHLGDHDPSGIDMTRDIGERLELFAERPIEVRRIALNMSQIDAYQPPPNPAKVTDSRFKAYQDEYGSESWELDALSPEVLVDLIADEIRSEIDVDQFNAQVRAENEGQEAMRAIASRWSEVTEYLAEHPVDES